MFPKFEQFIRERSYLKNVTPRTVDWYRRGLGFLAVESPTQDDLKGIVMTMRERGMKATGCNSVIRAINAYLHWHHNPDIKCSPACPHVRVSQLKEPELILPTFSLVQIKTLLMWKPKTLAAWRLLLLIKILLDTGCRISEALRLRVYDFDFDNLLVTLDGKGRKQRIVPFSLELRKALYRFVSERRLRPGDLLLCSRTGGLLDRNNTLRRIRQLCRNLGFQPPNRTQHAFRHTFAINYLRRGGSVFHLQKILGHSTLEMTRRYVNLLTEDLQAVHENISLLGRLKNVKNGQYSA